MQKKKVIPTLGHSYGSMNAFFSIFYCKMDTVQQTLNSKKVRDKGKKIREQTFDRDIRHCMRVEKHGRNPKS